MTTREQFLQAAEELLASQEEREASQMQKEQRLLDLASSGTLNEPQDDLSNSGPTDEDYDPQSEVTQDETKEE